MRLLRSATLFIATALLALGLSRSASADLFAYAATAQGDFGKLDLDTGAYTSIGSIGCPSIVGMGSIGGTLYGVDNNADGAGFYSINTSTGAATLISTLMDGNRGADHGVWWHHGLGQLLRCDTRCAGQSLRHRSGRQPHVPHQSLGIPDRRSRRPGFTSGQNLYVSEYTGDTVQRRRASSHQHRRYSARHRWLNDGSGNGQASITGLIFGYDAVFDRRQQHLHVHGDTSSVSSLLSSIAITGGPISGNGDQVFACRDGGHSRAGLDRHRGHRYVAAVAFMPAAVSGLPDKKASSRQLADELTLWLRPPPADAMDQANEVRRGAFPEPQRSHPCHPARRRLRRSGWFLFRLMARQPDLRLSERICR